MGTEFSRAAPPPSKHGQRSRTKLEAFKSELEAFLSELEAYGPVR